MVEPTDSVKKFLHRNVVILEGDSIIRKDSTLTQGFVGNWIIVPDEDFFEAKKEIEYLHELLMDLLRQSCSVDSKDESYEFDSMAISTYAEAMRHLASLGKLEIQVDVGRRVIAHEVTVSHVENG